MNHTDLKNYNKFNIAKAMELLYEEIYVINLENESMEVLKGKFCGFVFDDFTKVWTKYCREEIHPNDQDLLWLEFMKKKSCLYSNNNQNYFEMEFRRRIKERDDYEWIKLMVVRSDEKEQKFVYCFLTNINDKKSQQENEKSFLLNKIQDAKNSDDAKSEFLSRTSHEIRTPLNSIIGMTWIAMELSQPDGKMSEYLNKINTSSCYLLSIVNDILDMSKIESGKLELMSNIFTLSDLVESLKELFGARAEGGDIQLTLTKNSEWDNFYGDGLRLKQVLVNLISNAIKFTMPGGQVHICISELDSNEEESQLYFSIKDTGIGIRLEDIQRIFKAFEQAELDISTKVKGTGLGLAISKSLVEMMGGKLSVKSEFRQGSEFYFDIKLKKSGIQKSKSEKKEGIIKKSYDFSGMRFLLVEDNELNAEVAAQILTLWNASLEIASNGKEAIEIFLNKPIHYFHAIIMDVVMPIMNGIEATKKIRLLAGKEDAKTIPIIGMSANAYKKDIDEALEAGMNGYLSKPVHVNELYDVLQLYVK